MGDRSGRRGGLSVMLAGLGINLALGVLYAWSVFKGALQSEFGFNATQSALPFAVCIAVFSFVMGPAGAVQDRFGPRLAATVGSLIFGAGFLVSGMAGGAARPLALFVVGFGVVTGLGMSLAYVATIPAAVKWFAPQRRGLITGMVVSGFGLAPVYIAPLAGRLLARYGVASSFTILGLGFTAALVALSQLLKNPAPDAAPAGEACAGGRAREPREYSAFEMLKTRQFHHIWLLFCIGTGAGLMIISFIAVVTEAGIGFWSASILAVGNACGRLAAGAASDRLGRRGAVFANFLLQAAALLSFERMTGSNGTMILAAWGVGLTYGAYLSVFPCITADYFGLRNLGVNYGLVTTASGVAGLVFPTVAGRTMDAVGSYGPAYIAAAALCLFGGLLALGLREPASPPGDPAALAHP